MTFIKEVGGKTEIKEFCGRFITPPIGEFGELVVIGGILFNTGGTGEIGDIGGIGEIGEIGDIGGIGDIGEIGEFGGILKNGVRIN